MIKSEFQTIDLLGFTEFLTQHDCNNETVNKIKRQLWEACSEQGFFYIKNHGIDQQVINDLFITNKKYFSEPTEVKNKDFVANNVGYSKLGQEQFTTELPDYKESFNLRRDYATNHKLPPIYEKNKQLLAEFIDQSWGVVRTLLTGMALSLGLEPDFFNKAHTNLVSSETVFRTLHYPPLKPEMNSSNIIRAGSHSDFGTLTLLLHETASTEQLESSTGLQVRAKNKDNNNNYVWHDVPAKPGCIIVNIADLLSLWTEGRFHSAVHRVVIPKGEIAKNSRYAIGHFINPDATYKIYPVKSSIPAPHPAIEISPGVQKASFGEFEFIYGDTGDVYFQRRSEDTNY